jgi:hypothetical protein
MTNLDLVSRARDDYVTSVAVIIARCFPLDQINDALLQCDYESKDTLWAARIIAQRSGR